MPEAQAAGKCVNCHDVHGYNMDGTGLIPSLLVSREEKLCLVCHDGSPAAKNINDDCDVLKVRYGDASILMTGDIQAPAMRVLLGSGQDLKADV